MERDPFSAKNQDTLRSYRVYILPTV